MAGAPPRLLRTMTVLPAPRKLLLPATAALLAVLVLQACNGGPAPGPPTPAPVSTPTPTLGNATPRPVPTLEPVTPVTLGDRVTFYGEAAGDGAMGLAVGDFNGDGVPDVALSAAFADGPDGSRPDSGRAYIFFGPFTPGEARDAALGQQDATIMGAGEGDQLGRAVAAADLNGDGVDDLILGAPFADDPTGQRAEVGVAYVLFGSPSWPAVVDLAERPADVAVIGTSEKSLAGFSLATADLNGDGVADLVVGAFWADGLDGSRPDSGEAYVVYGSAALPATIDLARGEQDVTVYGGAADDRLTEGLAVGDVNGDGVGDLVIAGTFAAGPEGDRPKAGEVYVIFGGRLDSAYDLAERPADIIIRGSDEGDQIGHSIAVGDFDGDGFDDLLLGAVSADGPGNRVDLAGEAYLVFGAAAPPAVIDTLQGEEPLRIYGSGQGHRLGRSAAMGDLNGDGRMSLLVAATGAPSLDGTRPEAGNVYVIHGRPAVSGVLDLAVQPVDIVIEGLNPGDVLGVNTFSKPPLLTADMNGDRLADILVSARGAGPAGDRPGAGEAYILFARR